MSVPSWLLAGFIGTLVLTTMLSGGQRAGLTRMSMPFLLGSMLTADRDRARLYGLVVHLINGFVFALVYVAIFHTLHRATWWLGALIGISQALVMLTSIVPLLPGIHPRMASERHGPSDLKPLEPPGFMCLNYGVQTPVATILAHAVFGAIVGALYRL
jgi:hypothetical protein